MKVLLVEDDNDKRDNIITFINEVIDDVEVCSKSSISSGLQEVIVNSAYDLIVLDMSMPTFDFTNDDPTGGGLESFAGKEFLENLYLRGISIPVIVVTQFGSFGKGLKARSLDSLDKDLSDSYPDIYKGAIYYNSSSSDWKAQLQDHLWKYK